MRHTHDVLCRRARQGGPERAFSMGIRLALVVGMLAHPEVYLYTHIPKTGGTAFIDDVGKMAETGTDPGQPPLKYCVGNRRGVVDLQATAALIANPIDTCNFVGSEGVHATNLATVRAWMAQAPPAPGGAPVVRSVVLLRHPASHVVSMWQHCRRSQGVGPLPNGQRYAEMPLSAWLSHHVTGDQVEASKGCGFNPRNLQSMSLGGEDCTRTTLVWQCDTGGADCGLARETGCSNRTALGNAPDPALPPFGVVLARATAVVRTAVSVGVVEHYPESVCLANAKIAQAEAEIGSPINASAVFAGCITGLGELKEKHTHRSGLNQAVSVADSKMLDQLTEADEVLYGLALSRFHRDLAAIGHPMPWFQPA